MATKPKFSPWTQFALKTCVKAVLKVRSMAGKGTEVISGRTKGYRSFDPEVIRVDKVIEDLMLGELKKTKKPVAVLSEEAGRLNIGPKAASSPDTVFVICDPFDGSGLYRRQIPAFWFTSMSIWAKNGKPITSVVADIITGHVDFADGNKAYGAEIKAGKLTKIYPLKSRKTTELKDAYTESYLMKPGFMYPAVYHLEPLMRNSKFILPNGGPAGFADVAKGTIDIYVAYQESATEVFTGLPIAMAAGAKIKQFDGNEIVFQDNINAQYAIVVACTEELLNIALEKLRERPRK